MRVLVLLYILYQITMSEHKKSFYPFLFELQSNFVHSSFFLKLKLVLVYIKNSQQFAGL